MLNGSALWSASRAKPPFTSIELATSGAVPVDVVAWVTRDFTQLYVHAFDVGD
jgi:hypothetical protein